jgi:para-nitrobenzyl esterase
MLLRRGMLAIIVLVFVTMASILVSAPAQGTPAPRYGDRDQSVAVTHDGALRGQVVADAGYRVFKGIPYAQPPVGALRWAAPQPATRWKGVRDATAFGSVCPQAGPNNTVVGDEDCLDLNVYTPLTRHDRPLPVMFWIHGGSWVAGTGASYDASRLAAEQHVIVVTINYRLGVLGYLANSSIVAAAPRAGAGAFAALDQIQALRWVGQNIAAFGGDKRNVTIFGESAGGFDVCALVLSPFASGLFQRAISESGPCAAATTTTFKTLSAAEQIGDTVATNVGCPGSGPSVVACLRAAPVSQLLQATPPATVTTGAIFAPVVDGVVLPSTPIDALRSGQFNRVPVLEGTNHDEGTVFSPLLLNSLDLSKPADAATYNTLVGFIAGAGQVPASAVIAQYPPGNYASPFYSYAAALGDHSFSCVAQAADQQMARFVDVYAYEFNDPNVPNIYNFPVPPLTFHGSELTFVFGTPASAYNQLSPAEMALSSKMMAAWANFARYGNPNGRNAPYWPQFRPSSGVMLNLSPGAVAPFTSFAADHHCDFWEPVLYPGNA